MNKTYIETETVDNLTQLKMDIIEAISQKIMDEQLEVQEINNTVYIPYMDVLEVIQTIK